MHIRNCRYQLLYQKEEFIHVLKRRGGENTMNFKSVHFHKKGNGIYNPPFSN